MKKIFISINYILVVLIISSCSLISTDSGDSGNSNNKNNDNNNAVNQYVTITGYGLDLSSGYNMSANNIYHLNADFGNDDTGDGSESDPWQSFTKIKDVMRAGDLIILHEGNYGRFEEIEGENRSDWITFKAAPGSNPIIASIGINNNSLRKAYLRFDGININYSNADSNYGVNLKYTSFVEIRNCPIIGSHRHEVDAGVRAINSEYFLIYNCEVAENGQGMTFSNNTNVTISNNHIHDLGGGSGIQYAAGNSNFIIEKNNIYDSNQDTSHPDCPDDPHGSGISVKSNDVWIKQNIFHDIGSSSGIMTYDTLGEEVYSNIFIDNNLFYDIHNNGIIRFYFLGKNVYVRNNTIIGKLREDTNNACYKLYTALTVTSLANGYDGSGLHVYNNICVGSVTLPAATKTANNIFWTYAHAGSANTFLGSPPDPDTKILTNDRNYYPINYFTNDFFVGIEQETDFTSDHNQTLDFHLDGNSEAVNFGDINCQIPESLGTINSSGFIQNNGKTRNANFHSTGCYEN